MHESLLVLNSLSDFVKELKKEVHEIEIENKLILSCKAANSKYKLI